MRKTYYSPLQMAVKPCLTMAKAFCVALYLPVLTLVLSSLLLSSSFALDAPVAKPMAKITAAAPVVPAPSAEPILLGTPTHSVTEEPMTDLSASPPQASALPSVNGAPGRWAYMIKSENIDVMKLMVQTIKKVEGKENTVERDVTIYPVLRNRKHPQYREFLGDHVSSPRFSPDGASILLELYGSDGTGTDSSYLLYILDMRANTLKKVAARRLKYEYEMVSWSPDGKYLAYLEGGSSKGDTTFEIFNDSVYLGPLRLFVCEWRTGKEQLVVENDSLSGPFSWLAPHILLYNVMTKQNSTLANSASAKQDKKPQVKNQNEKAEKPWPITDPRSDIYRYEIEKLATLLLIRDGAWPIASPDGKWIAFFGSEDPTRPYPVTEDWRFFSNNSSLSVVRSDGTDRVALNRETGLYPKVRWLPDSRHLITVKQVNDRPEAEAEVKQWDRETKTFSKVTQLKARDGINIVLPRVYPKFSIVDVTQDNVFVRIREDGRANKIGGTNSFFVFQQIDLKTGTATTLADVPKIADWRPADSP